MIAQDEVYFEDEQKHDQPIESVTPPKDSADTKPHKKSNGAAIASIIFSIVGLIVLPFATINSQISINDRTIPYTHGDYVTFDNDTYRVYIVENAGGYYLNGYAYLVWEDDFHNPYTAKAYLNEDGDWIDPPTGIILVVHPGSHTHWTDWKTIGILILPMAFLLIAFIYSRVGIKRANTGASLHGLALSGFIISVIGTILWAFCFGLYLNSVL